MDQTPHDSAIRIKEYPQSKMMSQTFSKTNEAAKKLDEMILPIKVCPKAPKVIVNTVKENKQNLVNKLKQQ
jgi:hypothetical protein